MSSILYPILSAYHFAENSYSVKLTACISH